ncbi:unnamed protein product [Withania somnifera]
MNRKGLAVLMRTKMRPLSPTSNKLNQIQASQSEGDKVSSEDASVLPERQFSQVQESMHSAMLTNKTEIVDVALDDFSEGYSFLSLENRYKILLSLAKEYDLNRTQVRELMKQHLDLQLPSDKADDTGHEEEGSFSTFYRIERNLRQALKPMYEVLFERDVNIASLRALDSHLKEKLITWLSPANLELHNITWDDPASLLEKVVAYEAVHPISNLIDLKRRLGIGRRCFGYFHPTIPGEPLIFIEVALMKDVAATIQEVLWDNPPIPEHKASCAIFYSISSTQSGLSGVNLGKFLIKRVVDVVKKDIPNICVFATLSPIPGYRQWLLSKFALSGMSGSAFGEKLLRPEEEKALMDASGCSDLGNNGIEVMWNLLTSKNHEWTNSPNLVSALRTPMMRLCARYLMKEKKRGKALDSVANFHLQNGAVIGRLNWMADRSHKGLVQSVGIMVNYIYRLDNIEDSAQAYLNEGHIESSSDFRSYIEDNGERADKKD